MEYPVCRAVDLLPDKPICQTIAGHKVLVVQTAQGLFAVENECPHQSRSLERGVISGDQLSCIFHSVTVSLATGKLLFDNGYIGLPDLKTYPVVNENGTIFITLPQSGRVD